MMIQKKGGKATVARRRRSGEAKHNKLAATVPALQS